MKLASTMSPYIRVLICFALVLPLVSGTKMFCYYSSDARWRNGLGSFMPPNIDPKLCTHIIFAFAKVYGGRYIGPNSKADIGPQGLYAQTIALKKQNPGLKVLLAVGGWFLGSKPFVPIVSSTTNMEAWIGNVVSFLREHDMDGLDMDWEFPGVRGSPPQDKYRFPVLMQKLHEALQQEATRSGKEKLILTLATAAGSGFINACYEPKKIIKHIDYMLLMAYNYHGAWEDNVGHHSGIYPNNKDKGWRRELNQEWSVNYWLEQGMPRDRLIMGIATYGMCYTLLNRWRTNIGDNATGGCRPGEFTKEKGVLSYFEICRNLRKGWKRVWIKEQMAPYAYGDGQWVGYDDVESIGYKAQYIMQRNLGGAFVWSVEMDDHTGQGCYQGRYPLLTTIFKIIKPTTTTGPTSKPNPAKPTSRPGPGPEPVGPIDSRINCLNGETFHPDPDNCRKFFVCVLWGRKYAQYHMTCPTNTGYDKKIKACMWAAQVGC